MVIADREVWERMGIERQLSASNLSIRRGTAFASSETAMIAMATDAHVLAVGLGPVTARVLQTASSLELVVKCGIGTDNIDLQEATRRKIRVVRTSGVNFGGVAEYVIGSCISYYRRLARLDSAVRAGQWAEAREAWAGNLASLSGKSLGMIGYGAIGRQLAHLAAAHGMDVMAFDPYATSEGDSVRMVPLEQLLAEADIVSVHAVLSNETRGLIGEPQLALMKPTAILVNTARGPIVQQEALVDALRRGTIAGALLDVLETEPPLPESAILAAPNCLLSPHVAGCTADGYLEIGRRAAELITDYLSNRPFRERDVVA